MIIPVIAAAVVGVAAVLAQGVDGPPAPPPPSAAATTLRTEDLRVASVAYRLGVSGASLCAGFYPVTGLLLHHLPEYDGAGRQFQIERYRLDRGPGVLATVAGSPAARSGLAAGDVLLSVNGVDFADPRAMAAEKDRDIWRKRVEAS